MDIFTLAKDIIKTSFQQIKKSNEKKEKMSEEVNALHKETSDKIEKYKSSIQNTKQ